MPQIRDFFRSGRGRPAGTRDARALVSAARELLGRFEEMGARTFALARAVSQPAQLERLKCALERASAPRALKLPMLRASVLDGVERELRESRRESVEACTPLRCGEEVRLTLLKRAAISFAVLRAFLFHRSSSRRSVEYHAIDDFWVISMSSFIESTNKIIVSRPCLFYLIDPDCWYKSNLGNICFSQID